MRVPKFVVPIMFTLSALTVTGCGAGGVVAVDVAEDARNPLCASVVLAVPDQLGGGSEGALVEPLAERATSSQGTAAWGLPSAVVLRCGVPVPGPTTDTCVTVSGVDWVNIGRERDTWTFVSYGREPATEVTVDTARVSAATALEAISPAVDRTEEVGGCVGVEDATVAPGEGE